MWFAFVCKNIKHELDTYWYLNCVDRYFGW
jgi:hypothetical protein